MSIRKVFVADIIILAIPLLLFLSMIRSIPFSEHLDEAAAVLGLIAVVSGMYTKTIRKTITKDLLLILGMVFLAVFSNLAYGIVTVPAYIMNDMFSFLRIFLVFAGSVVLFEQHPQSITRIGPILGKTSAVLIMVSFVFGVLNLLGIVNMSKAVRFGFRSFSFVFSNPSQFGIFIGAALALYINFTNSKRIIEIVGLAVLLMTGKGTSFIIIAVYVLSIFFVKRKIKWWHVLIVVAVLSFVLRYQIEAYFINDTAPRAILLYYGLVSAIEYFPLGAGFATYGSNMAAVHYSPLYYEYGFNYRKALTVFNTQNGTSTYLNDTYLGMIFGEFGLFGAFLFFAFTVRLWKRINSIKEKDNNSKHIIVALFVCLCGSFMMLGSIKNAPGQILMFVFASYFAKQKMKEQISWSR